MTNKAHAELSASGSEIWLNCPGSVALSRKAPPKPESPYAVEGTTAHELLEKWANHFAAGYHVEAFVLPKKYPPAMLKAVQVALDELKAAVASYREEPEILVEQKVSLEFIGPDMFGTVDLALVDEFGTLQVMDYKHGSGVKVEVYKETAGGYKILNTQLVYYALGLAKRYRFNFRDARLVIIQPRYSEGAPVSEVIIPISELMSYIDLFKAGVKRTQDKNARRFAGPWCRFCKAKPICPETKESYRTQSRDDF